MSLSIEHERSLAALYKHLLVVVVSASVAGCGGVNADVERETVILQCDGETTSTISHSRKPDQRLFRISGKDKTFEVWNESESTFRKWGSNETLKITSDAISYDAAGAAVRTITIDRASGRISDEINALFGLITFVGDCKPVASLQERERQF